MSDIGDVKQTAAKVLEEYGSGAAKVLEEVDQEELVHSLITAGMTPDEVEQYKAELKARENLHQRAEAIIELSDAPEDTDVCRWVGEDPVDVSEYKKDEFGEFHRMTSTEQPSIQAPFRDVRMKAARALFELGNVEYHESRLDQSEVIKLKDVGFTTEQIRQIEFLMAWNRR